MPENTQLVPPVCVKHLVMTDSEMAGQTLLVNTYTAEKFLDEFAEVGIGFAEFHPHARFPSDRKSVV